MPGTSFTVTHGDNTSQIAAQLSAIVQEVFMPTVVDQTKKANPFFDRFYDNRDIKYGEPNIVQRVRIRDFGGAEHFDGLQAANLTYQKTRDAAVWQWAYSRVPILVPRTELTKTAGKADKVGALAEALMKDATADFRDVCGNSVYINPVSSFYNTAPANVFTLGPNGLTDMCRTSATTGHTYGGLAFTTTVFKDWINQTLGTSAVACNWPNVNKLIAQCNVKGRGNVSLILTSLTNYYRLSNLAQSQQFLQVSSTQELGFQALVLNGIPVMVDWHCPGADTPSTITAYDQATGSSSLTNPLYDTNISNSAATDWMFALSEENLYMAVDGNMDMQFSGFVPLDPTGSQGYVGYIDLGWNIATDSRRSHGVMISTS